MGDRNPGPFRDDREGLRAEVERLSRENEGLRRRGSTGSKVIVAVVALGAIDLAVFGRVTARLNARSDAGFWIGVTMVVALVALHAVVAVRVLTRR